MGEGRAYEKFSSFIIISSCSLCSLLYKCVNSSRGDPQLTLQNSQYICSGKSDLWENQPQQQSTSMSFITNFDAFLCSNLILSNAVAIWLIPIPLMAIPLCSG